jgi:hypothetical protein
MSTTSDLLGPEGDRGKETTMSEPTDDQRAAWLASMAAACLNAQRVSDATDSRPPQSARDWNPMETLYVFMAWLTTRQTPLHLGATYSTPEAIACLLAFAKHYELDDVRDGYDRHIVPLD